jgi:hypothetical protein
MRVSEDSVAQANVPQREATTMLDRLKFFRKRPSRPRGDTLYRLATVAAALTVLLTIAFL